jgi:hypothetical protein
LELEVVAATFVDVGVEDVGVVEIPAVVFAGIGVVEGHGCIAGVNSLEALYVVALVEYVWAAACAVLFAVLLDSLGSPDCRGHTVHVGNHAIVLVVLYS